VNFEKHWHQKEGTASGRSRHSLVS